MSLKSREARKLAIAGITALAAFGTASSAQAAINFNLKATCKYPLVGIQPLDLAVVAEIPEQWQLNVPTDRFQIKAVATAGGNTSEAIKNLNAYSVDGESNALSSLKFPSGFVQNVLVPLEVEKWARVGTAIPSPLVLNASGSTPELTLDEVGDTEIFVDGLEVNLAAYDKAGAAIEVKKITTDIDGLPFSDSDGDKYTFDVSCKLIGGSTKLANIKVVDGPVDPPENVPPTAPSAIVASAATQTGAELAWTASTDSDGTVASYDVTVNGKTTNVTTPKATITGLEAGKDYPVSIVAIDDKGAKSPAGTGSITTLPADVPNVAPTAPGAVTATPGKTDVALSWGAATDSDGTVASYEVTVDGKTTTATGTTATVSGLTEDTTYTASVVAVDDDGATGPASTKEFKTTKTEAPVNQAPTQPGEATVASVADITDTTAKFSWPASTDADGTVVGYEITWEDEKVETTTNSVTLTGLGPDSEYKVEIRAKDNLGALSAPREFDFITAGGSTTQPVIGLLTPSTGPAAGGNTISIGGNNLAGATKVTFGTKDAEILTKTATEVTVKVPAGAAGEVDVIVTTADGASGGLVYTYTGGGEPPVNVKPTAPTAITAGNVTQTGADLTWTASTDSDGTVASYDVTVNGKTTNVTEPKASISGLTAGTDYPVSIVAIDDKGAKSDAGTGTFKTTAAPVDNVKPTAPTAIKASAITQTGAELAWTASTDSDGTVASYDVTVNGKTTNVTAAKATISGLTAGTDYPVSIVAIDDKGAKSDAGTGTFKTLSAPIENAKPTAPKDIKASAITQTGAELAWTASTDSDGTVASYDVTVNGKTTNVKAAKATITGLTADKDYPVSIVAIDDKGAKSDAGTATFKTLKGDTPPVGNAPTITKVTGTGYAYIGGVAVITGTNLKDIVSVKFGNKKATTGLAIGTKQLIVVAPPQVAGSYKVTVETKAGVSAQAINFTYKRLF